jgi:hypothetical protein
MKESYIMSMMICNSCGSQNANGTKFCGKCGVALPAVEEVNFANPEAAVPPPAAPPPAESPAAAEYQAPPPAVAAEQVQPMADGGVVKSSALGNLPVKKIAMFGVPAVVLLIVAIVAAIALLGGSAYSTTGDLLILPGDDVITIVYNNGRVVTVNGEMSGAPQFSLCRKRAALIITDGGDGNELLYISGSGQPTRVARDVDAFRLADSGKGIVYWADYERSDREADLFLFNGRSSSRIASGVFFTGSVNAVISPNGSTVFYVDSVTDGEALTFISRNGRSGDRFERSVTPVAIADNARHIYYVRHDENNVNTLRVRRGTNGTSNRLSDNGASGLVALNANYSQAVVNCGSGSDARAFISVNGGERVSFHSGTVIGFITPNFTQGNGTVYGFSNFKGKVFMTLSDGVYLLVNVRRGDSTRIVSNEGSGFQMSQDGKQLFYLRGSAGGGDATLRVRSATNHKKDGIRIARDVRSYAVTPNGRHVYFVDKDYDLNRARTTEDANAVRVAEPIDATSLRMSARGTLFFRERNDSSETLYYTTNTSRNRVDDEVEGILVGANNVFFYKNAGGSYYDLFRSNGNHRFKKIATSVRVG